MQSKRKYTTRYLQHAIQMEDVRNEIVSRLYTLGDRAMEQHFANPHPWGTVSKPGPSHLTSYLVSKLEAADYQRIYDYDIQSIESIWESLENRDDIEHPFSVSLPTEAGNQRPLKPSGRPEAGEFWESLR